MKVFDHCDWAVCFEVAASTQDDRQPGRTVCAWFAYPFQAEEFIEKVLPSQTRERFHVVHRSELER